MSEKDEIEKIRQRKMLELQRQAAQQQQAAELQKQQQNAFDQQKNAVLMRILSSEARVRLQNVKMVKKEFAETVEIQLIQLYQKGILQRNYNIPMSDEELKTILQKVQKSKRDTKIRIV